MRLSIYTEKEKFDFNMSQMNAIQLLKIANVLEEQEENEPANIPAEKMVIEYPAERINAELQKVKERIDKTFTAEPSEPNKYPINGKYKGFLLIRCSDCGQVKGFCAKQLISKFRCDDCGGVTKLVDLRAAYMDCKCGRHFKYRTNEKSEIITYSCMDCGAPVDMMLNSKRTAYTTIK